MCVFFIETNKKVKLNSQTCAIRHKLIIEIAEIETLCIVQMMLIMGAVIAVVVVIFGGTSDCNNCFILNVHR